ncbi:ROK family protein [Nanchangia anserum]|uniref:ROK family protein n=1 Tax=Nanchangia anserum TaxID=2692125 RepID=UPI001884487B|nr:ROK family protein [Nanchangia anserum]QOX81903.1 ROK family protein [Nanchangia anserum]
MGIVSEGAVHRGEAGASGELAHIQVDTSSTSVCRCGRRGCLETFVSGGAFEATANRGEVWWNSPYLKEIHDDVGHISMDDVFSGIAQGDQQCVKIAADAGIRLAGVLAVLATIYNPAKS